MSIDGAKATGERWKISFLFSCHYYNHQLQTRLFRLISTCFWWIWNVEISIGGALDEAKDCIVYSLDRPSTEYGFVMTSFEVWFWILFILLDSWDFGRVLHGLNQSCFSPNFQRAES